MRPKWAQEEWLLVDFDVLELLELVVEATWNCKQAFCTSEANKKAHTMKLDQGDVTQEGWTPSSKTCVFVSIICAYCVLIFCCSTISFYAFDFMKNTKFHQV